MMKSAKSSLVKELKEEYSNPTNKGWLTCIIYRNIGHEDCGKIKTKHLSTFEDFCDAALNCVKMSAKYVNRTDLVLYSQYTD